MTEVCFEFDPTKASGATEKVKPHKELQIRQKARRNEYISRGEDTSQETRVETFIRLKQQTYELRSELTRLSLQPVDGGPPTHDQTVNATAAEVKNAIDKLGAVTHDAIIGAYIEDKHSGGSSVGILLSTDEQAAAAVRQAASAAPSGKEITYSLYSTPSEKNPLLDIDRKLSELERLCYPARLASQIASGANTSLIPTAAPAKSVVAVEDGQHTEATATTVSTVTSLFAKLMQLQSRLDLLSEHKLDMVMRRTKNLLTDMDTTELPAHTEAPRRASSVARDFGAVVKNTTAGDSTTLTSDDKEARLASVAKLMESHTATAAAVPSLTQRLMSQADYHDSASKCCQRLQLLQQQAVAIEHILHCDRANLTKVQSAMGQQAETMARNFAALMERLGKLK